MEKWFSKHSHCFRDLLFHLCCHWFSLNSPDTKLDPMQKLRIYSNQVGMANHLKIPSTQWGFLGAVFIRHCLYLYLICQEDWYQSSVQPGGGQDLCEPTPFLRELDKPPTPLCTGTNTQRCLQPAAGGKIKHLFKSPNPSGSTNQPPVQKVFVNPEMTWEFKNHRQLGAAMALPRESHAEGVGSISEQFTLSVTARIWLVSACAACQK